MPPVNTPQPQDAAPAHRPGDGQPLISVDVVPLLLDREHQRLSVVVGERIYEPHLGAPALPGVLLAHERVDDAAQRALSTKVHAGPECRTYLGDLGVFDNPDRDPRGPTLSIAKIATLDAIPQASGVQAIPLSHFPPPSAPAGAPVTGAARVLPFDHDRIVRAAIENATMRIWTDRAFAHGLLGHDFSTRDLLTVLRDLAALTSNPEPNPANAQRRLRASGWVKVSDKPSRPISGRPSLMWRWV
jgi:8-oxo-dGTP diphosphatase